MPRFVILLHRPAPNSNESLHYDFMLEVTAEGSLATWRWNTIPTDSSDFTGIPLTAHRLEYLEYEGEVSGNRGSVQRKVQGAYSPEIRSELTEWTIRLSSPLMVGDLHAQRISESEWKFHFTAN